MDIIRQEKKDCQEFMYKCRYKNGDLDSNRYEWGKQIQI